MLLDGNFQDEDFKDEDELVADDDEFASRPVPGIGALLTGTLKPKPYPFNFYFIDDESYSGIAGTLHPDGRVAMLPWHGSAGDARHNKQPAPKTRYWEDACACFREGGLVWDGVVAGSIEHGDSFDEPHRRLWDASITGDWPNHPPRAEKLVNPEKAREAAEEAERDRREWN
jgi:hypothetical protein